MRPAAGGRKQTDRLSDAEVGEAYRASVEAWDLGRPLNRFVTIAWELGGVEDALTATRSFIRQCKEWARRRGTTLSYIAVFEHGPAVGTHAHILLHMPPDLAREQRYHQRRWLVGAGATYRKNLIRTLSVGRRLTAWLSKDAFGEADFARHSWITFSYLMKCCSHEARRRYGLTFAPRCSPVTGRRLIISNDLGRAARAGRMSAGDHLHS